MPVYLLFIETFTAAWGRLSTEDREKILARVETAIAGAEGKVTQPSYYAASETQEPEQSAPGLTTFGVIEFPSDEKAKEYLAALANISWSTYVTGTTVLGRSFIKDHVIPFKS